MPGHILTVGHRHASGRPGEFEATKGDTMSDYGYLEIQGSERSEALEAIRRQIAEWGLTMPNVEPVPLHFGLGRFREIGETEFWVANERGHGYCGKFLFLFDGQTCPHHHHQVKHETFFMVRGSVSMNVAGQARVLNQGDVLAMPPGTSHSFTGVGPALVLEVSTPTLLQDNFFEDPDIGHEGVI